MDLGGAKWWPGNSISVLREDCVGILANHLGTVRLDIRENTMCKIDLEEKRGRRFETKVRKRHSDEGFGHQARKRVSEKIFRKAPR